MLTSHEVMTDLDAEAKKALPRSLHAPAEDLNWDHPRLREHVLTGIAQDLRSAPPDGKDFYRSAMEPVHHYMAMKHGHGPDDHVLTHALLALTSGSLQPDANFVVTDRMLDEGRRRARIVGAGSPFRHIPLMNEPDFEAWMDRLADTDAPLSGHGSGMEAGMKLFEQHLSKHPAAILKSKVGYTGYPIKYLHAPGHPSHGKIVQITHHDEDHAVGDNPEGLPVKNSVSPKLDANGKVTAKGWTVRSNLIRTGLADLQRLVAHFHDDHAKVAEFLKSSHPQSVFRSIFKKDVDPGYLPAGSDVPGSFILGPKFGPFTQNLSGNYDHLTSDMWHGRTMNRYIGKQMKGKGYAGPRTERERAKWFSIMQEAAKRSGMKVADVQALLWAHEQKLHRDRGVKVRTATYAHGVKKRVDAAKKNGYNVFAPEPTE